MHEVTIKALRKTYGPHAATLLAGNLRERPRKRGAIRKFRVIGDLPSVEEFAGLREKRLTFTVTELVREAFGEFRELSDELWGWYRSLPRCLRPSSRGYGLEEAARGLNELCEPHVPATVGEIEVRYTPPEGFSSHGGRRDDAVAMLRAAMKAIGTRMYPLAGPQDGPIILRIIRGGDAGIDSLAEPQDGPGAAFASDARCLIDELEGAVADAEDVTFPSTFGGSRDGSRRPDSRPRK
jgi:hypothetical protein